MSGIFWTNTIWYLMLFVISAVCVAISLGRAGNRRFVFAFFLSVVGLIYIMEHTLIVYFSAYHYHTGIYYTDQTIEDTFGNIFSQTSIAATAMVLVVFDLSFAWNIVFAAAYYLIEIFFGYLGIYEHVWYRTWFTPVILVLLFWVFKKWYRLAASSQSCLLHRADVFLSVGTAAYHLLSIPLLLLGIQLMKIGLFPDAMKDHRAVMLPFGIILVSGILLLYEWKAHWAWKSLGFVATFAFQFTLHLLGILNVKDGWFIPVVLINILVCYGFVHLFDLWYKSGNPAMNKC